MKCQISGLSKKEVTNPCALKGEAQKKVVGYTPYREWGLTTQEKGNWENNLAVPVPG
jgi:hypothetical protein